MISSDASTEFVQVLLRRRVAPEACRAMCRLMCCLRQVDKHLVVSELGIHYRDLRIVDPQVQCFGT